MIYKILLTAVVSIAIMAGCDESDPVGNNEQNDDIEYIVHVPADALTIQIGIDSAKNGDTVLVADGIYTGDGNRDICFKGKRIVLKSENGPDKTIIDIEASATDLHRGFFFNNQEDNKSIVDGFTVTNGFSGNGGAVNCQSSSPLFIKCIFINNKSHSSGGAIWCKSSHIKFVNCTIVQNSAFVASGATPFFENCIIAFHNQSLAVYVRTNDLPVFKCSNIFGNSKGDWVGDIAEQVFSSGNFSDDPKFCNLDGKDVTVQAVSPCLPENNSCDVLIGALGEGCL